MNIKILYYVYINMLLGKGGYGSVIRVGDCARKKFKKVSHLTQEYIACKYLENAPKIVRCLNANLNEMEMDSILYENSLNNLIENGEQPSIEIKSKICRDMTIGLLEIHKRNMLHGDIKSGNILYTTDKDGSIHVVVADLGFVSTVGYSKVERTAEIYREVNCRNDYSHDMYSLGIVFLEIFGWRRIRKQYNHARLCKIAKKYIQDKRIRRLIYELTQEDYTKRPSASDILKYFFGNTYTSIFTKKNYRVSSEEYKKYENVIIFFDKVRKEYNINMVKKGSDALIKYIVNNSIDRSIWNLYVCSTLFILSAVFGPSGFSGNHVKRYCKDQYDFDRIHACIYELCNDEKFRCMLFE